METKHTNPLSSPGTSARDSFLGFVGGCVRFLFTGSWKRKSPLESSGPDLKFEAQVRNDLRFLFEKYDAKIISNNYYYRSFGNAIIVIDAGQLFFRVVRDRGEIRIDVAPGPVSPIDGRWTELGGALAALTMDDSSGKIPDPFCYATLSRAADFLEPALPQLQEALSESHYETTSRRIKQISESYMNYLYERIKLKTKTHN